MQNINAKKLYMATSLKTLNNFVDVIFESYPGATKMCKSAVHLFKSAEQCRKSGDEEKSYVLYMRYIATVLHIRKQTAWEKDKAFYDSMLGANIKQAHEWAGKLSSSLEKRYEMLRDEEETSERLQNKGSQIPKYCENGVNDDSDKPVNTKGSHLRIDKIPRPPIEAFKACDALKSSITCTELYEYLEGKEIEILVMDVRSADDYGISHLTYPCCISVPAECISPGTTAPKLERNLPSVSLEMWKRRGSVELIVLMDWNSSMSQLPVGQAINSLRDALYMFDATTTIKREPVVLSGGYESWLTYYPTHTTNARVQRPCIVTSISTDDILLNCDYPDLNQAFIKTPSQSPDNIHQNLPQESNNYNLNQHLLLDKNNKTTEKMKLPHVDRTTKPQIYYNWSQDSLDNEQDGRHNRIEPDFNRRDSTQPYEPKSSKPMFDRLSKPRPMKLSPGDVTLDFESQNISKEVLSRYMEATDADLQLEKNRLNYEIEIGKLKREREKEVEETTQLVLEKQEAALLDKLMEVEKEKKKVCNEKDLMKAENEKLKATLEDLVKQKDEEAKSFLKEIDAVRFKEQERLRVEKEANRLRLERKKKENSNALNQRLESMRLSPQVSPSNSPKLKSRALESKAEEKTEYSFRKLVDDDAAAAASFKREAFASRGLSRSQSFPNISQALDSEEILLSDVQSSGQKPDLSRSTSSSRSDFSTPLINRNVKPSLAELNAASNRNLMPVFGGQGRALTGLRNLGNSCYMNSILQCLSNTVPLAEYFVTRRYKNDVNRNSIQLHPGELVEEYAAVVQALHAGQYRCLSPKDLKRVVGKYQKMFDGCEQQDAQELLMFLMDYLHENLNKADKNKTKELQKEIKALEDSTMPVVTISKKSWQIELQLNRSIIIDLFQGQFLSTVTCCYCNKVSNKFDTFSCISLPIPPGVNKCNLKDCLQLFRKEEKMTGSSRWKCPRCKELREAKKRIEIYKLPHILIIHLKRFFYEGVWRKKLQSFVDFPLTDLDMREHVVGPEDRSLYNLYAITNHYGTLDGGHYTAFCKNIYYNKWFKYDDHEVQEIAPSALKSSAAYILYYTAQSASFPDFC